jgi:predicted dehydrogenase
MDHQRPEKNRSITEQNSVVRLELIGTRGEIIDQWFRAPGRAVLAAGANDWVFERQSEVPFAPATPFPLSHLIDCLESGARPVADIVEARKSFVLALAAYESAKKSAPVQPMDGAERRRSAGDRKESRR